MIRFNRTWFILFLTFVAQTMMIQCTSQNNHDMEHSNHLINETSPYLLQHAHNPVDWYPWSDEALKKAKDENKLIIVSIGYASCHWCHVMERESFEDDSVAKVMNDNFVSIKVDREERPDVDQVYMDAIHLMGQNGGWPLNCVALPDGKPIWAATYVPKGTWIKALNQLQNSWENHPDTLIAVANKLARGINQVDYISPVTIKAPFAKDGIEAMIPAWKKKFDMREGGNARVPKFPMPSNFKLVQRLAHFTNDQELQDVMDVTMTKMAKGGIYDQLGGGFARYSTDGRWLVPHFEKMMYDNGQLVSLYSEAYQVNPDPLYKKTVYQTIEWVDREMTSKEGGFYSSLDADSEGEEGKFYVWTEDEIDSLLEDDEAKWYKKFYNIGKYGNWEDGKNILHIRTDIDEFAEKNNWTRDQFSEKLEAANDKLMAARDTRVRPALDDKILASWNGLMLKGYIDAYRVFGEEDFLKTAKKNATFIKNKMRNGKGLYRNYKEGRATINAFLDDYAIVIDAYLALYQVTGEEEWLEISEELADHVVKHFFDDKSKMFFYTSDEDAALVARKMENTDNVIPASNSIFANVLYELGHLKDRADYFEMSDQMLHNIEETAVKNPGWYSNWLVLLTKHVYPHFEVVIAGKDAQKLGIDIARNHYIPNKVMVIGEKEKKAGLPLLEHRFVKGETRIYVCQNKACQLPVTEVDAAIKQIKAGF